MISPELNFNLFTSDLSHYFKNQVKVGLFGSGVGLSVVLGFSAAYVCYYLISVAKKPILIAGGKKFHQFLRDKCPVVSETYYPTFWCWESRVQTLLRPFVTAKPWVNYRNELITAPDGGQISLDWFDNDDSASHPDQSTRPTVLLLPGLTGTSRESYILHMVQQSRDLGYRCVVFNNRGVSGEKLLTPRTYCAANTEDLEVVIEHVQRTIDKAPLMAAGVSMGGMMLANYLGGPAYLTSCLQASVDRHRTILEKKYDIDHVMKAKTIREFDERFTSVMFGYPSNDDYYRDASPIHKIKSVQVPMLCLNAADDVFSPNHAFPVEAVKQNPNVALLITYHGGHIGFLEGLWPRQSTYMDRVFRQFTKGVFENGRSLDDLH
ncbi:phospholipase ABHD3-like [Cyprinus carpio]|uniref:Phospholipase ABHD3 n=1 Tax=Cyprinus carpio TaxID=7962 RepID=A0A9Q9YTW9_CYPCA|nr:phospholipase ABHD3-like [Cyprinus carpio]